MKSLQTDRQTDGRTDDERQVIRKAQLRWAKNGHLRCRVAMKYFDFVLKEGIYMGFFSFWRIHLDFSSMIITSFVGNSHKRRATQASVKSFHVFCFIHDWLLLPYFVCLRLLSVLVGSRASRRWRQNGMDAWVSPKDIFLQQSIKKGSWTSHPQTQNFQCIRTKSISFADDQTLNSLCCVTSHAGSRVWVVLRSKWRKRITPEGISFSSARISSNPWQFQLSNFMQLK